LDRKICFVSQLSRFVDELSKRSPQLRLGRELQLNIVELRKADRLGHLPERLSAWIAYFEHWHEETLMSSLSHLPVQKAIGKLRAMSADEEERYWAEAREKALRDEVTLLAVAREEGLSTLERCSGSDLALPMS
jgi:hypothetical protein